MPVDAFLQLVPSSGPALLSESQTVLDFASPVPGHQPAKGPGAVVEIDDFAFGVEQTLNIGSASTGAGAGKATFKEFTVTRRVDRLSPTLHRMACTGQYFKTADLLLRKSSGGATAGQIYLVFGFAMVAIKSIDWSRDDEAPRETITFEYGALSVAYAAQKADGMLSPFDVKGWDRVSNTAI